MEQWAELRREHFVRGVSIKELMRRTGKAQTRQLCEGSPARRGKALDLHVVPVEKLELISKHS